MTAIPQWNLPKPKPRRTYKPKKNKKVYRKLMPAQEEWIKDKIIAKQLSWLKDERPVENPDELVT